MNSWSVAIPAIGMVAAGATKTVEVQLPDEPQRCAAREGVSTTLALRLPAIRYTPVAAKVKLVLGGGGPARPGRPDRKTKITATGHPVAEAEWRGSWPGMYVDVVVKAAANKPVVYGKGELTVSLVAARPGEGAKEDLIDRTPDQMADILVEQLRDAQRTADLEARIAAMEASSTE